MGILLRKAVACLGTVFEVVCWPTHSQSCEARSISRGATRSIARFGAEPEAAGWRTKSSRVRLGAGLPIDPGAEALVRNGPPPALKIQALSLELPAPGLSRALPDLELLALGLKPRAWAG